MRKSKREGFQFSFGLKEQQQCSSARSTPKFPSIEIGKPALGGSERKNYAARHETQPIQVRKSPWDLFQDIGGGMDLLQRGREKGKAQQMTPLAPCNDTLSVESKDNRSVKSTKSLGERLRRGARPQVEKQARLTQKSKHSNSLANILELRWENSSPLARLQEERNSTKPSPFSLSRPAFQTIEDKVGERDTLKMENPFFEGTQNMQFRETKKRMLQALEKGRLGEGLEERERSKVFKNFLHKPRPTLRLANRSNNNDKIESISKKYDLC